MDVSWTDSQKNCIASKQMDELKGENTMQLSEKQELVRLLNLYQADLLDQNRENIENGIGKDFAPGVKAQYEHARIISTKLSAELGKCIKTW